MDFWSLGMHNHHASSALLTATGFGEERRGLFRRCLNCDPNANPTCPTCAAGEQCQLVSPSCDACAFTQCTKIPGSGSDSASVSKSKPKSSAGPIAGGVIGGIVVIFLIVFLIYRFCIKKRREEWHQQYWQDPATNAEKEEDEFPDHKDKDPRASTHTVGSIASTVLTRASNIIQIAYIPGVTNRSVESTPDLIPPVPPIPAAQLTQIGTPHTQQEDQHFFMPSDIRDSSYSGYNTDDRTSFARSSMTPSHLRSSMATYRGNVNPTPAQLATRGKATPISLKSMTGNNSPTDTPRTQTPPVPAINLQRTGTGNSSHSPIVARLGVPRAVTVTRSPSNPKISTAVHSASRGNPSPSSSEASRTSPLTQPPRRPSTNDSLRHDGTSSTFDEASSSEDDSPADASLMGWDNDKQAAATKLGHSPFKTPTSAPDLRQKAGHLTPSSSPDSRGYAASESRKKRHKRSGSLNQIIEEATRRASREPRHGGLGSIGSMAGWKRANEGGPFSDDHVAGTP